MKIRPLTGFIIILLLATAINAANVFSIANIQPISQIVQSLATTAPDFTISVSPSFQTISQGQSTSYQVTVTSINGFTSDVWLSVSGLPSGAIHSWSTNPVSPPSNGQVQSVLFVATSLTASTGTFSLAVFGSSGTLLHTQYISLSINAATTAAPDFTISASPNSLTIRAGNSGTYLITLTSVYGFNSPVLLGVSGLPQGVSYDLNPSSVIPTGSSVLTVAVPQTTSTTTMSYTLTITGTGGGRTHSGTVTLYVIPTFTPDFTISAYPSSQMITPGQTVTYTVSLTSIYGFSSSVSLSATGLPATATSYFDPQSLVPPGTSKLTVTLPTSTATTSATITYTIEVTGTGGGLSHSTTTILIVSIGGMQDFGMTASPSSLVVAAGGSGACTITVTSLYGFNSPVSFIISGLPNGAGYAFSPATIIPTASSTLVVAIPITTATTSATVSYTLIVTGFGGGKTHSTSITLYVVPQVAPIASWTFMVYMGGDNNLENFLQGDLNQMKAVGSTSKVNMIVLFDRYSTNDAVIYYVEKGSLTTKVNWGPTNMGDPETLKSFIVYSASNYPAYHYILILSNHGGGFRGVIQDDHSARDLLTMPELRVALSSSGIHFDVVGFDACLMAMVEVAYQIKGFSDYMVGSEEVSYGFAGASIWHYDLILTDLVNAPQMSGRELASTIVKRYGKGYPLFDITFSAIDLARVDDVASSVSNFAQVLKNGLSTYRSQIRTARTNCEHYYYSYYIDLYDFASLIWQDPSIPDTSIKTASIQVINAVGNAVISEWHQTIHSHSHGLSIYFDTSSSSYNTLAESYRSLDFVVQTQWNELLEAYLHSISGSPSISSGAFGLTWIEHRRIHIEITQIVIQSSK